MERKCTDKKYYVRDNAYVSHQDVRIYCITNQFPALPFFCPYCNTHGTRGMSKNYHLRLDPKLDNGVCEILYIPCACVACT